MRLSIRSISARSISAAIFLLLPLASASAQGSTQLTVQPGSKVWVEGTSTMRSWQCAVPEFSLTVKTLGAGATAGVLAGEKPVRSVELSVPAMKMDCNNGTMNDHMREALKAEENPVIRFTLASYEVAKGGENVRGTMHGTLSLGGVQHPIDVKAVATDAGDGAIRIVGGYDLALSAFDLKRPSLFFGTVKVGDLVQVKFDLVLKN